jgi:hypothetical protein
MKKTIFNGSAFGSPGIIYGSEERESVFMGIHFGFSAVREHQIGLNALWNDLGVPHRLAPENFGLKMYTVTKFPKERFFFEKGETHTCLTFESGNEPVKGWGNEELDNQPEHIATAWDDKSFGIVVPNRYYKEVNELYKSFERKDILVQYRLDQTYLVYPLPYLWISILSHINPGEEKKPFRHIQNFMKSSYR